MVTTESTLAPRATDRQSPWWRTRGWLLDMGVGVVAGIVFLVFLTEPQPVDPMIYLETAMDPSGAEVEHRSSRLGVVFPTWLVGLAFGHSEITFYALPFVIYVVLAVTTSNLGRAMFAWWVGPAAALLTLGSPFVFLFATQLLPDIPSTALSVASLTVLYHATRRLPGQRSVLLIVAGVVFGAAFLMRETVVLFLPGLVLVGLLWGARWRGVMLMLAGSLIGPVLDLVGNAVIWGDPLARVESVFRRTATTGHISEAAAEAAFAAQSNVFKTFWLLPQLLWESVHGRVLLIGFVVFLVVICLPGMRRRELWGLPLWVFTAWVIFAAVATIQPDSGTPVLRLVLGRYWAPFVPFLALMTVGSVALVMSRLDVPKLSRVMVGVVMIGAVALMGAGINRTMDVYTTWFMRFGADSYWQLREALREIPDGGAVNVPDGIDPVVRIYTNDPLGRPVGDFDMVVGTRNAPVRDGWYLFHEEGLMAKAAANETEIWPPDDFELMAHETDTTRDGVHWALYGPESVTWDRVDISEIDGEGSGWQQRLIAGDVWEDPTPFDGDATLDDSHDMVIFDDTTWYGDPNPEGQPVPGGSVVEVVVDLDLTSGVHGLDCQFFPVQRPEERVNVRASAMRYRPPFVGDRSFLCDVPDGFEAYTVRPVLIVRGPADLQIGEATVSVHYPAP